jgi:uncharacterized membrane protein
MNFFSLGTSAVSSFIENKIKFISVVIVGTIIITAAIGFWLYVRELKSTIHDLTETNNSLVAANKILESNNAVLQKNNKDLETANSTNVATIRKLNEERQKAIDAVKALANTNLNNKQTLDRLNAKIEELLKDPKSDGPVAPVLREVIREIQKERDKL